MLGSNQPAQIQRLDGKVKILYEASLDILLSNKQITKALIRLCRSTGWSAPLLFAYNMQGCLA